MFTALLDTSVLWPSLQRDALLSFAVEWLFRPTWSSTILDELAYQEEKKLVRRGADRHEARQRAANLIKAMRTAFDDAEVQGWEPLEGSYGLPDANDEHVVAAAVVAGAGMIVTHNLKDFPRDRVPASIDMQSPAEFAHNTVSLNPPAALCAIEAMAGRSGRQGPILTVAGILDTLSTGTASPTRSPSCASKRNQRIAKSLAEPLLIGGDVSEMGFGVALGDVVLSGRT